MANIFYSMSGEGRGHAARAVAIVESLRHQHDITLFAPDQAYDFLSPRYSHRLTRVRVFPISGLRFHYVGGRLALRRSIGAGLRFWSKVSSSVNCLVEHVRSQAPDIVITDFEPLLPRAAERCGVPYISLDHQHFLTEYDLSDLPRDLRMWAWLMKWAVLAHYNKQKATIVTSFFHQPLLPGRKRTISVGPIVRSGIRQAQATRGEYVVSYCRRNTPDRVVEAMKSAPGEVRIYGLGERPRDGNLTYHAFDQNQFVKDLAGCSFVIGAAGNQTLGEALHLRKPVLALPEDKHFEQRINAHYLDAIGAGKSVLLSRFCSSHVADFVSNLDNHLSAMDNLPRNGTANAIEVIQNRLGIRTPVGLVA